MLFGPPVGIDRRTVIATGHVARVCKHPVLAPAPVPQRSPVEQL